MYSRTKARGDAARGWLVANSYARCTPLERCDACGDWGRKCPQTQRARHPLVRSCEGVRSALRMQSVPLVGSAAPDGVPSLVLR
jgi:hypothetical protein